MDSTSTDQRFCRKAIETLVVAVPVVLLGRHVPTNDLAERQLRLAQARIAEIELDLVPTNDLAERHLRLAERGGCDRCGGGGVPTNDLAERQLRLLVPGLRVFYFPPMYRPTI